LRQKFLLYTLCISLGAVARNLLEILEKTMMNQWLALVVHSLFRFFAIPGKKAPGQPEEFIHSRRASGCRCAVHSHCASRRFVLTAAARARLLAVASQQNAGFA
jgi:hypothetical protein